MCLLIFRLLNAEMGLGKGKFPNRLPVHLAPFIIFSWFTLRDFRFYNYSPQTCVFIQVLYKVFSYFSIHFQYKVFLGF